MSIFDEFSRYSVWSSSPVVGEIQGGLSHFCCNSFIEVTAAQ